MPHYRLIFAAREGQETRSVFFEGEDAAKAFLIAQHHKGPAQLWEEDRHVCTLHRSGNNGEVWVISQEQDAAQGAARPQPA